MTRFTDCRLDDAIVERARRGDLKAHELVYRTFSVPVFNLALRMMRQTAAADEILQETFVEVLTKIDSFRGDAPVGAWIRRITVNKCLMQLRSVWHQRVRSLEPMIAAADTVELVSQERAISDTVSDRMDLESALDALPPISRTVVWLHDVEGYTHNEIGELMGKSVSFSKSQLARAHKRLQVMLGNRSKDKPCMQVSNNC